MNRLSDDAKDLPPATKPGPHPGRPTSVTTMTAVWDTRRRWLGLAARLLLGGVFLAAGLTKVSDLPAAGRAVAAYQIFPFEVARIIGAMLPVVEIVLAVLLIAGVATRAMAGIAAGLLVVFIAGIASVWARGLSIDCGCFGNGGAVASARSGAYAWEITRDAGLLIAALYLIRWPRTVLSVDQRLLG